MYGDDELLSPTEYDYPPRHEGDVQAMYSARRVPTPPRAETPPPPPLTVAERASVPPSAAPVISPEDASRVPSDIKVKKTDDAVEVSDPRLSDREHVHLKCC